MLHKRFSRHRPPVATTFVQHSYFTCNHGSATKFLQDAQDFWRLQYFYFSCRRDYT